MSGVIKSGAAGFDARVRPFAFTPAAAAPPQIDPELIELRQRVLDLEAALAGRVEEVERLTLAAKSAFADGEAAGREAGRVEADTRRGEALDLLTQSAARAVDALDARLEAADLLAASLARTCLEQMFGTAGARAGIVRDLIRHQLAALREETAIEVRVSAEDFAAADAAEAAPGCAVTVSETLAAGDCTIRLRLGTLEAGLSQQWGALRAALEAMTDGGGAA
jgi:flagellar biosynthesis/type III secretory pathway protein FliH